MKKKVLPITSILLLIIAVYFYIGSRSYVFIDYLERFTAIPIILFMGLGIFYITQRQENQYAHMSFRLSISCIIIVLLLIFSFELYKPSFTLTDAEVKVADKYGVKVITEKSDKIIYNTDAFAFHTNCYLIVGREGEKENRFLFYPYSGEMAKIENE
ncbi:hypothetical protein ACQKND_19940 [Viridibacillus arvi]|uniref:hypothetical protein n=1 Tax=Viridibacillus arvi TaxID=263475 RepID=UPI003CFD3118